MDFIMNNKNLKKLNEELGMNDYSQLPCPERIIRKVDEMITHDNRERKIFLSRRIRQAFIATALVLSITGLSVIAATFGWHKKLMEYFGNPSDEQMELMNGSFDVPMLSKSHNGYTVNVLNTLADRHVIYVLYELVLPEETIMTMAEAEGFMSQIIHGAYLKNDKTVVEKGAVTIGVGSHEILGVDKNKITICEYMGINAGISDECVVTLSVGNMRYIDETEIYADKFHVFDRENSQIVGDFQITQSWNFKYEDIGRSIDVNKPLDINGYNTNTLSKIDISPISVWIIAEGDAVPTALNPVIKFKDGSVITYNSKDENAYAMFSSYADGSGKGYSTIGYVFGQIVDLSTIDCIVVGDQMVEIN